MPTQTPQYAIVNGAYVVGWTQDPLGHYTDYAEENPTYRQMFDYDLDPETEDFKDPAAILAREEIRVERWTQQRLIRMVQGRTAKVGYNLTEWQTVNRT